MTDSLRADHTGYMDLGGRARTPRLDEFAAEATVFEHYYPEGLPTMPVRTAWWTGLWTYPAKGWQPFQLDDVLLAEVRCAETTVAVAVTWLRPFGAAQGRLSAATGLHGKHSFLPGSLFPSCPQQSG